MSGRATGGTEGANGAVIGDEVRVGAGVQIGAGAIIGDQVTIEAGSTIAPRVRVEYGAIVRSGSTVGGDVPPLGVVSGAPAVLVGYDSPSSSLHESRYHVELETAAETRGSLTALELGGALPFSPRRCMMIYDVPEGGHRGNHAHRTLDEILICVHGSAKVLVDDGLGGREVLSVDSPCSAVRIPPRVWTAQFGHSPDAVLVVLASAEHDQRDYVHSYKDFLAMVAE